MIVETISGRETFAGGYESGVLLFFREKALSIPQPLHEAVKRPASGVSSIGTPQFMLASETNRNHGQWIIGRYAVKENSFLTVMIQKKLPGNWVKTTKQLMLYNRPQAALRRLTIPFSGAPGATLDQGHIEGRFDVLTLEQMLELGLPIESNANQFDFSDEDPTDFYMEAVIEAETISLNSTKREVVITERGKEVRIAKARRRVIVPK